MTVQATVQQFRPTAGPRVTKAAFLGFLVCRSTALIEALRLTIQRLPKSAVLF